MKTIAIILSAGMVFISGCAGLHLSVGAGYRKTPPELANSLLQIPAPLKFALSPEQIKFILSFLNSEAFSDLIKAALPPNNRVDLGVWFDMRIDK